MASMVAVYEKIPIDAEACEERYGADAHYVDGICYHFLDGLNWFRDVEGIADKHGVAEEQIKEQLDIGRAIELEHTESAVVAEIIALDHLAEIPDYYTRLEEMEEEAFEGEGREDRLAWQGKPMTPSSRHRMHDIHG